MSEISTLHPSAVKFGGLSKRAVNEAEIPRGDVQEYQQDPSNGLYYRKSGRLISSQHEGDFIERARAGIEAGVLFELVRVGRVVQQKPPVDIATRENPVFVLDTPDKADFQTMVWVDGEGLHQARPYNEEDRITRGIVVVSWVGDDIMGDEFAERSASVSSSKIRSAHQIDDPVLSFYAGALQAYETVIAA